LKQTSVISKNYLYLFMALHVLGAAGTFIFSKASFSNPMVLTVTRGLGSAAIFLIFTGWKIPKPDFTLREWVGLLGLGVLLVPLNQYCFLKGLELTVPGHSALLYAMTPLGVLLVSSVRISDRYNAFSPETCRRFYCIFRSGDRFKAMGIRSSNQ